MNVLAKSFIAIPLLLCAVLLLNGCADLTKVDPNETVVEDFWQTQEDARRGLSAAYGSLQRLDGTYGRWDFYFMDQRTPLSISRSPFTDLANVSKFTWASGYDFFPNADMWDDHYDGISRANRVIARVPEIDMDPGLRARFVGEAKFIRALYYFNLVNMYGNIPMPLTPALPQDQPEQRSPEEVWAQIEQDLQEAQEVLPETYSSQDEGRATRGAATALLARAHLQQHEWSEAASALEQVISAGTYGLLDTYRDNFDETNENHKESVFSVQFSDNTRLNSGLSGKRTWKLIGPQKLAFRDGQPTQWYFDQFFQEKTVDGQLDPRLEATIWYNRPGGFPAFNTTYDALYGDGSNALYWLKYMSYYQSEQPLDSPINFQVIRYADVLLMYAEALDELGRVGEAYAPVDQVRERVGLAPLSEAKPGLGQAAMRKQIEHELILEEGGEDVYWLYMLRHDLFSKDLQDEDPEFRFFKPGYEILPIPQSEVDLNPNVEQNPAWQ